MKYAPANVWTNPGKIADALGNNGAGVVGVNWRCQLVACKTGLLEDYVCQG